MRRPGRLNRAATAALLSGLVLGQLNGGCMERSEFQCEEALARLKDCCGITDASRFNCRHVQDSCAEVFPDIDLADARCIRAATCAELVARGACAWAAAVSAGSSAPSPGFCPP